MVQPFWKAACSATKIKLLQDPKIIFLGKYLREMKKMCLHKNLYINVNRSMIYNSKKSGNNPNVNQWTSG